MKNGFQVKDGPMVDFLAYSIIAVTALSSFLFLGMAQTPQYPEVSFTCKQRITPWVNKIIQDCEKDVAQTGTFFNQQVNCTRQSVFAITEDHDAIINKYGNVL